MRDDPRKGGAAPGKSRGEAQRALQLIVIATAVLWLISATIGVFAYVANQNRISDLQRNRISSCERTYEAFDQVFHPFFPPPRLRTAHEKHNLAKFDRTVDRLVRGCTTQQTP